jgi:hypothetical protein
MALAAVGFEQYWTGGGGPPPVATNALYWAYNSPWLRVLLYLTPLSMELLKNA